MVTGCEQETERIGFLSFFEVETAPSFGGVVLL